MLPHDRPLSEVEFVAFDLETTGLFPVVDRIVEFGAVRFRLDGRELGTWEQLVDPKCLIPPGVTDIHGITDAMVRGQPTLAQSLPGFLHFLGRPQAILLAHNATFDLGFLNFAAARTGLALPANSVIDTLDLARTCVRGAPSCRLEDLVVYLGLAELEDHRALSDSRLAMALFTHLVGCLERLRTVEDLFRGLDHKVAHGCWCWQRPGGWRLSLSEAPVPGFWGIAALCRQPPCPPLLAFCATL
ncbi:MAG: exonuclease domain-containing protein [Planctomycetota bacterium]|nr:exonuclease domain-containing protein [Planctomycetota bacterium]